MCFLQAQDQRGTKAGTALPKSARAAGPDVAECIPWLMAMGPGGAAQGPKAQPAAAPMHTISAPAPPAAAAAEAAAALVPQSSRSVPAKSAQRSAAAPVPEPAPTPAPAGTTAAPKERRAAPETVGQASPGPKAVSGAGQAGQRGGKAVMDSASSLTGRGRTLRRTVDPAEVDLTPRNRAFLTASMDKAWLVSLLRASCKCLAS